MARYLIETDKPVEFHGLLINHGIVPKKIIRLDLLTRKRRTTMMVQEAVLSWVDAEGKTGEEVVCTKYKPNVVDALNGAMEDNNEHNQIQ